MTHQNHIIIRNDLSTSVTLNIEPEGAFFPLSRGEDVAVIDSFTTVPVTIKLTHCDNSNPVIAIWPGDGDVRVEKDGVDVFDLIQRVAL